MSGLIDNFWGWLIALVVAIVGLWVFHVLTDDEE